MYTIKGKQILDSTITQSKLNLTYPQLSGDAATKQYVDDLSLSGLTGVSITSPSDTDILTYSGGTWVNITPIPGGDLYYSLSGGTLYGKATYSEELTFSNNNDLVSKKYVDDSIGNMPTSLTGLTDVTITSPDDYQLLRYSGGTWVNDNDYWTVNNQTSIITPTNVDLDVQLNSIEINEDAGAITLVDMSVSGIPVQGTEESYSFDIDATKILTIYSEADGNSGITNTGVIIDAEYQYFGDPHVNGSWRLYINDSDQLVVEKRESGTWQESGIFT